jgi:hexokinase
MIPTWVFGWPDGSEKGPFLAIDLGERIKPFNLSPVGSDHLTGGTNLRVCHVQLEGDGKFEITQAKFRLTEEQKQMEGELLVSLETSSDLSPTFNPHNS